MIYNATIVPSSTPLNQKWPQLPQRYLKVARASGLLHKSLFRVSFWVWKRTAQVGRWLDLEVRPCIDTMILGASIKNVRTASETKYKLFPSTRHQSFNQFKHQELSKKGFKSSHWRRNLQIQIISCPMPHWDWLSLSLLANHVSVMSTGPDSPHLISVAEN